MTGVLLLPQMLLAGVLFLSGAAKRRAPLDVPAGFVAPGVPTVFPGGSSGRYYPGEKRFSQFQCSFPGAGRWPFRCIRSWVDDDLSDAGGSGPPLRAEREMYLLRDLLGRCR